MGRGAGWGQAVLGRTQPSFSVPQQTTCVHARASEIQLFSSVINEGDLKSSPSAFLCLPVPLPHRALAGLVLTQRCCLSGVIRDESILLYSRFWKGACHPGDVCDAEAAALPAALLPSEGQAGGTQAGLGVPPKSILPAHINKLLPRNPPGLPRSSLIPSVLLNSFPPPFIHQAKDLSETSSP